MKEPRIDSAQGEQVAASASQLASRNWAANLSALRQTQPRLADALPAMPAGMEWVFARDGSLSAMIARRWWQGCSLPTRAAEFMLAKAETPGSVVCFLSPSHAAQLRVSLERMDRPQALLALVPDLAVAGVILACDDFTADIEDHRFFFAWGESWIAELDRLFDEYPGLPTPTQFIRPILADASPADALVEPAQKVFADHSTRRAQRAAHVRRSWQPGKSRHICVVAPSHFRLWDEVGTAMLDVMAADQFDNVLRFDPDDPLTASPLALATAAAQCKAVFAPNMGRADLPDLAPQEMPWITWLTVPRIPPAPAGQDRDALLVADWQWVKTAVAQGWRADRVSVAGWPEMRLSAASANPPGAHRLMGDPFLAIVANTRPLATPKHVADYSSHRVLWESITQELLNNPWAIQENPERYLENRMEQAGIGAEGFDRRLFLDGLIASAYQQGLARLLLSAGLPVKLLGAGWDRIEEFAPHAAGPIRSRAQLQQIAGPASALVHAWPMQHSHSIEATGKPIVKPDRGRDTFLRDAKLAVSGRLAGTPPRGERLTAEVVLRFV